MVTIVKVLSLADAVNAITKVIEENVNHLECAKLVEQSKDRMKERRVARMRPLSHDAVLALDRLEVVFREAGWHHQDYGEFLHHLRDGEERIDDILVFIRGHNMWIAKKRKRAVLR